MAAKTTRTRKASRPAKPATGRLVSDPRPAIETDVSIRKIANGYVIRESGMTGKGKNARYVSRETYSPTNPIKLSR